MKQIAKFSYFNSIQFILLFIGFAACNKQVQFGKGNSPGGDTSSANKTTDGKNRGEELDEHGQKIAKKDTSVSDSGSIIGAKNGIEPGRSPNGESVTGGDKNGNGSAGGNSAGGNSANGNAGAGNGGGTNSSNGTSGTMGSGVANAGSGSTGNNVGTLGSGQNSGTTTAALVKEVEKTCATGDNLVLKRRVKFPNTGLRCEFSAEPNKINAQGNLGKIEDVITARREQVVKVELPQNAVVCGMEFLQPGTSQTQNMRFDDEIIFLLNNNVIASSFNYNKQFKGSNPAAGELIQYHWEKIRGQLYRQSGDNDLYCLGKDIGQGSCIIPKTETNGIISIEMAQGIVHRLAADAINKGALEFSLVTTGDNNVEVDCQHMDFEFDVTLKYVHR